MVHTFRLKYCLTPEDIIYILEGGQAVDRGNVLFEEQGIKVTVHHRKRYFYDTVDREHWYVMIHMNLTDMMSKVNVTNDDRDYIYSRLEEATKSFTENSTPELMLYRIDYANDVVISNRAFRKEYINLIKKSYEKWGHFTKTTCYETSVEFENKSRKLIIYDKNKERTNKHTFPKRHEKDILRTEIQLQRRHITNRKRSSETPDTLESYLSEEMNHRYFDKTVKPIVFKGNYYTKELAFALIDKSSYRTDKKEKLKAFLMFIEDNTLQTAKIEYKRSSFIRYIKSLSELNINPILLPDGVVDEFCNPVSELESLVFRTQN